MKKILMKSIMYLSFVCAILTIIQSCGSGCFCTQVACTSDERPFIVKFLKDRFSENELESISIIRTDKTFIGIDTSRIDHYLNRHDFSIHFFDIGALYPDDFEIKDFNYLISNNSINQVDSIWHIDYDVEIISLVCNTCGGGRNCEDEYYEFKKYSDPSFNLNTQEQNGFEILIDKK